MKAQIFSHEKLIGTAELKPGDKSMGGVYGEFFPADNYYKHIRKAVWQFHSSGKPDYSKWESFGFNAQLDNGCFLFAQGGFTFDDREESPDEHKRIDIAGVDSYIIEDYILPDEPKPFLADPWEIITIEQKSCLKMN